MASSHETVSEALRTVIAGIAAGGPTGYAYTPGLVKRVSQWPDARALNAGYESLYLVRATTKRTRPYDGYSLEHFQEYRILCCRRFPGATDDPVQQLSPEGEQIAADMVADVSAALFANVRLGLPSMVIDIIGEPWDTDFDWYVPGWVIVELRIVVRYQHPQTQR